MSKIIPRDLLCNYEFRMYIVGNCEVSSILIPHEVFSFCTLKQIVAF